MWKLREHNKSKESEYNNSGFDKLLCRLLAQRNIDDINSFLQCDYSSLSDPYLLTGTKEASKLFCKIVLEKGTIGTYGDYDTDGIISSTMINELCCSLNAKCQSYLPSRFKHGYGLNSKSVKYYIEDTKIPPDLLIILDCGSNSEQEVIQLKEWGVKNIIVIDHHNVIPNKMVRSCDVFINWHMSNSLEMCTCGEVFQFIRAIRKLTKKIDPVEFLSYAAIGTMADVTPIIGDNRIIVKNGLLSTTLTKVSGSGLGSVIKSKYSNSLSQKDMSFQVIPKLNAPGRLDSPDFVLKLLLERNTDKTDTMTLKLNEINDRRKKIQTEIDFQATQKIESNIEEYKHGILIYDDNWNVGVVGVVASKLVEKFKKPVVIAGKHNDIYKGSSRIYGDNSICEILESCKELFTEFGGHRQAAGIKLNPDKISEANRVFNKACEQYFSNQSHTECIRYYDAELKAETVSTKTKNMLLDSLYPYCNINNPEPIFRIQGKICDLSVKEGDGWAMMKFKVEQKGVKTDLDFTTFSPKYGTDISGCDAMIYFSFQQGNFDNVVIEDVKIKGIE